MKKYILHPVWQRTLIYLQQISEIAAGEIVSKRNFLRPLKRGNTNKHFLLARLMYIVGFKVQLVVEFYFFIIFLEAVCVHRAQQTLFFRGCSPRSIWHQGHSSLV